MESFVPPRTVQRVLTWCCVIVLLAGPDAGTALATALSWKTAVSGNAGTAGNWTPAQVPTSVDDLTWNLTGAYTVTFDNTVSSSDSHDYRKGTVTIVANSPHSIVKGLKIGDLSGDVGTMALTTGTVSASQDVLIGSGSGTTGTLNINDLDATLSLGGTANLFVGGSGTGTVNATAGGHLAAGPNSMAINAHGTVLVSGTAGSPIVRSTMTCSNTMNVGTSGTSAVLTVASGGLVQVAAIQAATSSTGGATMTVSGNSSGFGATLTGSSLDLAHNTVAGAAAGTATLTVQAAGQVTISGATNVGDPDGGSGTLNVGAGGTFTTQSLTVDNTHGTLGLGGSIIVNGGAFKPPGTVLDEDAATTTTVTLENGASASFDGGSANGYALIVGDSHSSAMKVQTGSRLGLVNGVVALGLAGASSGSLEVSGSSSFGAFQTGQLIVGQGGTGTLDVLTGGHASTFGVIAGLAAGSTGTIHVNGAGSNLDGVFLDIGGQAPNPGGTGHVVVGSGGSITMNGDATSLALLTPASTLEIDAGGSVSALNTTDHRGQIILAGGQLTTGVLDFSSGASINGNGTVTANILADNTNNTITASGGPLNLGNNASPSGFSNVGTLAVGAQSVSLLDANLADLGNVTIAGGTLNMANGGNLQSGKTLSGNGTINGTLSNAGTIQATGAGLSFSGLVIGLGAGITGSVLHFLSGGGLSASGTVSASQIIADAGSQILAGGDLTLAATTGVTPLSMGGRLIVGSHLVTLQQPTSVVDLGTLTAIGDGTLRIQGGSNQIFNLSATDTIQGTGTVSNGLINNGVVQPGDPAGALAIGAAYTQNPGGKLRLSIGDAPTNQFGRLNVTGAASLGGTLDVQFLGGPLPSPGEAFTIMTYGSHTGTFSNVTFGGSAVNGQFTLDYQATQLVLTVNQITSGVGPAAVPHVLALRGRSGTADAAIELDLPQPASVDLRLFDPAGRQVAFLQHGSLAAGRAVYALRTLDLASGVYFARARVSSAGGEQVRTARAVWLR